MAFKTKLHGKVAYDFLTSNKHKAFSYLGWADKMRFVNQHEQLNSVFVTDERTPAGAKLDLKLIKKDKIPRIIFKSQLQTNKKVCLNVCLQ